MFNNITRSGKDFSIGNSTGIVGPDGRGHTFHQYNSSQNVQELLAKDADGIYFLKQSRTPAYTLRTDFDYRRLITSDTDITLIAVYSVPVGRGVNSFSYSPITLSGPRGSSIASRPDLTTWYNNRNNSDKFRFFLPQLLAG